jgi:hypothetical protein
MKTGGHPHQTGNRIPEGEAIGTFEPTVSELLEAGEIALARGGVREWPGFCMVLFLRRALSINSGWMPVVSRGPDRGGLPLSR